MDYDGNDTQDHNLKVPSEGAPKSPSVLRPYAFPRFDIDDSLQGHLRFDSLVEADVFLGIQSQDDNQWIEDFSRGTNVIDFSSSATESCSIARQNNVWSEATSSESVEMLLKSVGQEQILPKGAVSENSNTGNELRSLAKEMDSKFEQDNVDGESTRISNATMLQDELLNNFSALENRVEGELSQVEEACLSQENLVQGHESASHLCPNSLEEECKLTVAEGFLPQGIECDDKNVQQAECPADLCLGQIGDRLSHSVRPTQDINASSSILVSSQSPDLVNSHSEVADTSTKANDDGITEQQMVHADTQIMEQHNLEDALHTEVPHITMSAECVDKKTDNEVIIASSESSMISCAQKCQFELLEGRGKDNSLKSPTLPGRSQSDILSTSRVISAVSTVIESLTDDSEQHATKLGNPNAEHCSSSEEKTDTAGELDQNLSSAEVDNMAESSLKEGGKGSLVSRNNSQSSLIKGENEPSIDKTSNANIVDMGESLVGSVSSSSAGLTKETDGAESIKVVDDASAVNMEKSRSSGYREDFQVEADRQFNPTETKDVSVETKKEENVSLSTFVVDTSPGIYVVPTSDQGSSAVMRNMSQDEPVVNQPQSDNASDMETETSPLPCKNSDSNVEGNNEDIHKQVAAEVGSACESKSGTPLSGTDGKLIPDAETSNVASASDFPASESDDCSKRSQGHPDCDNLVLNKDPLKLECNSPTIISSVVLLPDERKQKSDGGSELAESKSSASEDLKGKNTSLDDNSFTFKVNLPLNAEKEKANTWTPFPIAETYKSSVVLEAVTTPDTDKVRTSLVQETFGNNPGDYKHEISKVTSGRKRRGSGKGVAKENLEKAVNMKETTPAIHFQKEEKTFNVSLSPHGLAKQKSKKLSTKNTGPTTKLPDLNGSALKNHSASPTAFHQPFTELQQVQLRAQIFVYGSLIQGTAPDEACMIAAFGPSGRGRGVWEPVWQVAVERVRSKQSQPGGESPMNSHSSGAKVPDLVGKQVSPETKIFPSSVSRASSKGLPAAILSPIIPLSSPLWSISGPSHDVSQSINLQKRPVLHYQPAISPQQPYHTPSVQNIIARTTRPSQAPASPSPWVSQTSALNVNAHFSTPVITETVKLTPIRDFSLPAPYSVKDAPSLPLSYTDTTSTVFPRSSQLPDHVKGSLSSEMPPADSKPRRRKKAQPSDSNPQNPLPSQAQPEKAVASYLSTLTSPLALVTSHTGHVTITKRDVVPGCSTSQPQVGDLDDENASSCSKETLQKVEDARLKAEEAAGSAATAISHCQSLWSQLAKQDSRMDREVEAQIAAAAGAAAAAASVAKAAAAAARVASNAALQAKIMAEEVFNPTAAGVVAQSVNPLSDVQSVGSATPASILTTEGGPNRSSSIPVGAEEAAKRKIQAASAAAKQAENIDCVLEAAKLSAEAVSQAGKVVAMGELLSLKELISAGPEGYWKLPQASSKLVVDLGNTNEKHFTISSAETAVTSSKEYGGRPGGKISDHGRIIMEYSSNDLFSTRSTCSISGSIGVGDNDPGGGKIHKVSDMVQFSRGHSVHGSSSGIVNVQNQHELDTFPGSNVINEGSVVEVYKDGDGLKPAWFSANVLTLHDGKALVQHTSLLSKEGSDNLKEWVALEGEGDKAPRIRAALPLTTSHSLGTRKRRRTALGSYAWSVGDMVDVWIQDSWCEGVVTEKNEKDETTLTVHFPARGETSTVSTQQLRSSRIWTDGNWVQWLRSGGHDFSNESDMPLDKRPRLKSPSGKSKSEGAEPVAVKPEDSKLQALSCSDTVFNFGKSSKAETKPSGRRTLKTGLQRDGSRVVFGVPKPGKKRKFVEVSKHFPAAQKGKDNESKDQVKFAKYLMPHRTASRGGKNQSKVGSKEKQSLRNTSLNTHGSSCRTLPQGNNLVYSASSQYDEAMRLSGLDVEKSVVREEGGSKMAALTDLGSSGTYESGKGPLGSSFKKSSSSNKPGLPNRGKLAPAGGKFTKVDEKGVYNDKTDTIQLEPSEPRRSNRRIQPTHRLLEGLQSSLIIPKMTSASQDKGQGQKNRSTSVLSRGK